MALLEKTVAVAAIENGTVIDHIPAGKGLEIARLLGLQAHREQVCIGINLTSASLEKKDLIKISRRNLTEAEEDIIAIVAPEATINVIKDFAVISKHQVEMPSVFSGMAQCQNRQCITNHEQIISCFYVARDQSETILRCHYCRKEGSLVTLC